jgi:predicted O-methyltransferase YrrM
MYSPYHLALKYLQYWLTARNGKGHGIHSPFVFDLVTQVFNDAGNYYCYAVMEGERQQFLSDHNSIEVQDLGAGSRKGTYHQRQISSIAQHAVKPPKYSRLLFRMANYFKCKSILELGTSLGITTGYLAHANHAAAVITLEGVPDIAALAKARFKKLGLSNVKLVEGNFDETLAPVLSEISKVDLAYIDGNHRLEPTLRYFNQMFPFLHADSLVIFDDIHWSAEMEQAWKMVKDDKRVTLTIDLFFIGLVFFKPDFKEKQHFSIRF